MILNIETGRVYETAAEAARAVGVGSSGISKVLSGKQRAAKGYHFLRVEEAPEKAALTQIRRQTTRAQTRAQRERYAAARKAASAAKRQRDRAARQAAKEAAKPKRQRRPAASPELREARAKLREAMIRANRIAEASQRSGEKRLQEYVDRIKAAAAQTGTAQKRSGLFGTSPQAVTAITLTETDAYQMIAEISAIEEQYQQQIQGTNAALESQYGLRAGEGAAKRHALQQYGRAMGMLRELVKRSGGEGKYRQVYETMTQGDAEAATAEQIEQIAQEIMDYVDRSREYERAEIDAIMDAWRAEVYSSGDDEDEDEDGDGSHRGGEYIPWDS